MGNIWQSRVISHKWYSDIDTHCSGLNPRLSFGLRGAQPWAEQVDSDGAALCQQRAVSGSLQLLEMDIPHPFSFLLRGSHSVPPFKFCSLRKLKPSLSPLFTDANHTQGLSLACGPGRRATLRTSIGRKWQSRRLVHRLESRQAFRHRHGRWVWMVTFASAWLFHLSPGTKWGKLEKATLVKTLGCV